MCVQANGISATDEKTINKKIYGHEQDGKLK
jgi:hypothetical protein